MLRSDATFPAVVVVVIPSDDDEEEEEEAFLCGALAICMVVVATLFEGSLSEALFVVVQCMDEGARLFLMNETNNVQKHTKVVLVMWSTKKNETMTTPGRKAEACWACSIVFCFGHFQFILCDCL